MKSSSRNPSDLSPELTSRRRAIRLAAPNGLTIRLSDPKIQAEVLDISHGGVGLATNFPLRHGGIYTITFRLGTRTIACSARAAHVRRHPEGAWRAGMAFLPDEGLERAEQLVDELLDGLLDFS
jgi:c-di-GMP-binding flagellar brake protein YcgR